MNLLVGCPVRHRSWILERWFTHLHLATRHITTPHVVFVGDPRTDGSTFTEIDRLALLFSWDRDVVEVDEKPPGEDGYERVWNHGRYAEMVELRNRLLGHVRKYSPDLFWSVDSDILLHPLTLTSALTGLERFDAVGSKTYMTTSGTLCPSFAMLNNGGLQRWADTGFFPVDVIMAVKLMTPPAYHVDYVHHVQGEDIGWSIAARDAGLKLGWDGTYTSRHVMAPHLLEVADDR